MRRVLAALTAGLLTAGAVLTVNASEPAATAESCGSDTPIEDGEYVQRADNFTEAAQTLTTNCIVKRHVLVVFPAGVHEQADLEWNYWRDGQRVSFTTEGFEDLSGCDRNTDQAEMATFSGSWTANHAVAFNLGGNAMRELNYRFYCMKFTKYVRNMLTIKARVADDNVTPLLSNVLFDQMVFYQMGNATRPDQTVNGTGAIGTANLVDLEVRNSTFTQIANRPDTAGLTHALYLRRGTRSSAIHDNTFMSISGDPIRFTNQTRRNYVWNNTFTNSGEYALASDWHNGVDDDGNHYMLPSWYNQVHHNTYDTLYGSTSRPRESYCYDVQTTCPTNRIETYDNVPS